MSRRLTRIRIGAYGAGLCVALALVPAGLSLFYFSIGCLAALTFFLHHLVASRPCGRALLILLSIAVLVAWPLVLAIAFLDALCDEGITA